MAPRAASTPTPVTHRFKVTGDGRIKHYKCSCGNWNMTGSEKRAKVIREQFDKHAESGGLASVQETPPPVGTSSGTHDSGDAGSSGSDSGSAPNE